MVTEPSTSQRSQDEIPEISAFRYSAESTRSTLNPLNLNGLTLGNQRRTLSNRMACGIRFLVSIAASKAEPAVSESVAEDMSVLRYHLPIQEYRARRKRSSVVAKKLAIAGAVLAIVPLAMTLMPPMRTPKAVSLSKAPVVTTSSASASIAVAAATIYVVQANDTLSGIARSHHVRLKTLLAANGLRKTHRLSLGEVLKIPGAAMVSPKSATLQAAAPRTPEVTSTPPITSAEALAQHEATGAHPPANLPVRTKRLYHRVQNGDTLSTIAERYGLKSLDLVEVNDLDLDTRLRIGRKLMIPPTPGHESKREKRFRERSKQKLASRGLLGDLGRVVSKHFLWPTMGKVSSYFGYRGNHFHAGLDIPNAPGAPIHASKAGVVIGAGWEGAYGKMVDISHGNGVVTRYAHCSKLMVHVGDRVSQGQNIALIGETGHATGPHLHYEVRVNGRPVNPKNFI